MENVLNIEIIDTEDKEGQKGPYLRVQTNKGWMSSFEEEVINLLKENKGNIVSVVTTTNGPYINIIKFSGVVERKGENPITSPTDSSLPFITDIQTHAPGNVWPNLTDAEITFVRRLKKAFE